MPSPLPFVHLFVSRIKAPLPFHLLAYSYLARSATKPISLQRTPPDDSPRVARLGSPLSALGTLSTNSTSKIVESRSEEEPVRTSSTRRPIDCACMRASRERGPLSRCDRDRARRFSSSFFLSFFFLFSPPLSSTRALIQNILAARQVAPVDARSRLTDSTNSRQSTFRRVRALPTYLPTTFLFHPRG